MLVHLEKPGSLNRDTKLNSALVLLFSFIFFSRSNNHLKNVVAVIVAGILAVAVAVAVAG